MKMVAKSLLAIDAVGFAPEKPITFKSGIISPVYVDNRRLPFHPQAWHTIIHAFANVIQRHTLTYDIIAGVAMGGVPHSCRPCLPHEKTICICTQSSQRTRQNQTHRRR
jgi:orotate phosphoribosyltransferase